jgi:tRNA nucleotidyltransferase (CCA-adding enzyme)
MYEVTTFRRDVETDGRHAVVEFADSIEEDLARRDFTINALAWRPATDELRDPFAGQGDLRNGILRAVGQPADRFAEDYLRVLRGLRFAGRFSLEIEPATREALEAAVPQLGRLSAERVREELAKVLADARPSAALHLYADANALSEWYPELSGIAAGDPRWELNLAAVDAIPRWRTNLRLVRWLIPMADDPEEREALGRALTTRLKFSTADTRGVADRLRHYPILLSPVDSSAEVRRWLAEVGPAVAWDLFRLHAAECRANHASEQARFLVAVWRKVHDEWLESPPLSIGDLAISGEDLLALGVGQGPAIGILLDELHAEVLEDPGLNRRDDLLERARELISIGGLGQTGPEWPGELS